MHVEVSRGALLLRFGKHFGGHEAERLQEAIHAFMPVHELTLDFSAVHEFEDATVVPLARMLAALGHVRVRMHGLTMHQWRMLGYFGVRHAPLSSAEDSENIARA